jgi:uncharacterized protein (DUF1501 family)
MSWHLNSRPSRRELLRAATAGVGALGAASWLGVLAAHASQAAPSAARRKSCILLWMAGGPSHLDTFDLKPDSEFGGEFKPIDTAVPGIRISEHLPKVAQLMHHGAVIRGMSTTEPDHDRGSVLMHTGFPRSNGGVRHPNLGAVVSKELGRPGFVLPNFVVCGFNPSGVRLDPNNSGFLGPEHRGFIMPTDMSKGLEDLRPTVSPTDFDDRIGLLTRMEDAFRGKYRAAPAIAHQSNLERSLDLMRAEQVNAFDLSPEPASVRAAYGSMRKETNSPPFGQSCLLARRLVEVGVPFVEVVLPGWDTHGDNFPTVRTNSEIIDQAVGALVGDLKARGLLDDTLIVWMGEFGRTPKFENHQSGRGPGRGHYARAWSTLLLGGGIRGGQVIGRTDKDGASVEDRPVSAPDFMATVCEILGIDWTKIYDGPGGRTVPLVDKGANPIKELLPAAQA